MGNGWSEERFDSTLGSQFGFYTSCSATKQGFPLLRSK